MKHKPEEYTLIALWHTTSYSYYVMDLQRQAAKDDAPLDAVYWDDRGGGRWVLSSEIKNTVSRARLGLPPLTGEDRPFNERVGDFSAASVPAHFFARDPEGDGSNASRAGYAAKALIAYDRAKNNDEDIPTAVGDLLADLRHFCDGHGLDFDALNDNGARHYGHEANEKRFKE
jgi:hypothetical protein